MTRFQSSEATARHQQRAGQAQRLTPRRARRAAIALAMALCGALLASAGCRMVTPESYYHLRGTLVDAAPGTPMANTRVAASFTRVANPDNETDAVVSTGWTDPRGTLALVLKRTGTPVNVSMWGAYEQGMPDNLDKVFLYVWRGTTWQRIQLELNGSIQENAIPGRRWVELGTLKIPLPARKSAATSKAAASSKESPSKTAPGRPEVPPPPPK